MSGPEEHDEGVPQALRNDAEAPVALPDDLWGAIEADLDTHAGLRERVRGWSTPRRQILGALGMIAAGAVLVLSQGVREDLDHEGWWLFATSAVPFAIAGIAGATQVLSHRGHRVFPHGWGIAVAWLILVSWSVLGPWPGMSGVPNAMTVYCFGMTSVAVLFTTLWLGWLERATWPVPTRVGLASASAGLVAFAAQSVFCPGSDVMHLIVGHGGAGVLWALVVLAVLSVWRRGR